MSNKKWLVLFICTFLLSACAVTGPADDGFDNSNEWVDIGRLFSGENKTIYKSDQKQASVKPIQAGSMALDEKTEFEQFKKWNKLRTEDRESAEYQEFLQWLNYQSFKTSRQWQSHFRKLTNRASLATCNMVPTIKSRIWNTLLAALSEAAFFDLKPTSFFPLIFVLTVLHKIPPRWAFAARRRNGTVNLKANRSDWRYE